MIRCEWVGTDPLMIEYHDTEWGVPLHDDQKLFEFLCLEGAQAGLSWKTILHRRQNYRLLFDNFNPELVAKYSEEKKAELLLDRRIIRNKLKVNAFVINAEKFLDVQEEFGSFDQYIWSFIVNRQTNCFQELQEIPSQTEISKLMSKDLKKRGFKFVGATIAYAFMQATGMVNDHVISCFRYEELL